MIVLKYENNFGTSDIIAMQLAQQDIEFSRQGYEIFCFGNRTYLEEWLLAQLNGDVGDFQVKVVNKICVATNGNLSEWPSELLIALEQYKRRVKLSFS